MFVEMGFGFVDVGKNRLKQNKTVGRRKTGEPYSTRLFPMANIYIFAVKFL
jgi:hypothetical protein